MRAKTVVIGGGVVGCAVALKVARNADALDEPVVLLERTRLGAGSSGRSGAILRQLYSDPRLALMARDSLRELARFEGVTARPIGFRRTGLLSIAGPARPEWIGRLEEIHADLHEAGIDVHLVGPTGMSELIPGLKVEDGSVGVWEPEAGFVDPLRTVEAFAALARTYGAVTRLGVEVTAIEIESGRVTGVVTSHGRFEAERVVVCAGPWSRRLLAQHGVDLPLRIARPINHFLQLPTSYHEGEGEEVGLGVDLEDPLQSMAEQVAGLGDAPEMRIHPIILDLERGFYARCEPGDRRTRVGRTDYEHDEVLDDPDDLDEEVSEADRAWARAVLVERMPVYAREPDVHAEAALYTLTPDAMPVVGAVPDAEGLYVASGFSGHGFKLAPSIGEGLAQLLRGDKITAFEPELFAPERFAAGAPTGSPFGL